MHGNDPLSTTSEASVPKNTTPLVDWRPAHEKRVTEASEAGLINGIIVRPAMVYGRSGSITALLFAEALRAKTRGDEIQWAGEAGGRWATIHVDDLADLFVRVVESVSDSHDNLPCALAHLDDRIYRGLLAKA